MLIVARVEGRNDIPPLLCIYGSINTKVLSVFPPSTKFLLTNVIRQMGLETSPIITLDDSFNETQRVETLREYNNLIPYQVTVSYDLEKKNYLASVLKCIDIKVIRLGLLSKWAPPFYILGCIAFLNFIGCLL